MIAFLKRRRAQANHSPIPLTELAHWNSQRKVSVERAQRNRKANRRWLRPGGES